MGCGNETMAAAFPMLFGMRTAIMKHGNKKKTVNKERILAENQIAG